MIIFVSIIAELDDAEQILALLLSPLLKLGWFVGHDTIDAVAIVLPQVVKLATLIGCPEDDLVSSAAYLCIHSVAKAVEALYSVNELCIAKPALAASVSLKLLPLDLLLSHDGLHEDVVLQRDTEKAAEQVPEV